MFFIFLHATEQNLLLLMCFCLAKRGPCEAGSLRFSQTQNTEDHRSAGARGLFERLFPEAWMKARRSGYSSGEQIVFVLQLQAFCSFIVVVYCRLQTVLRKPKQGSVSSAAWCVKHKYFKIKVNSLDTWYIRCLEENIGCWPNIYLWVLYSAETHCFREGVKELHSDIHLQL